jgi:hypothetical protein
LRERERERERWHLHENKREMKCVVGRKNHFRLFMMSPYSIEMFDIIFIKLFVKRDDTFMTTNET